MHYQVAVEGPCSSEQGGLAPRQPVVRDPLTGAQDMGEGDGAVGLGRARKLHPESCSVSNNSPHTQTFNTTGSLWGQILGGS